MYWHLFNSTGKAAVSFVYGQVKPAPVHPTSILRLELCGAVLATQATRRVLKEIDMEMAKVTYYTDSKVVQGYIRNESKRFYVYVANRVQEIHSTMEPHQWRYVESEPNPADLATRCVHASKLMQSVWLSGPNFLSSMQTIPQPDEIAAPSDKDPEVRKEIVTTMTKVDDRPQQGLAANRFERFSSFAALQRAIALLIAKVRHFKRQRKEGSQEAASWSHIPAQCSDQSSPHGVQELQQATSHRSFSAE